MGRLPVGDPKLTRQSAAGISPPYPTVLSITKMYSNSENCGSGCEILLQWKVRDFSRKLKHNPNYFTFQEKLKRDTRTGRSIWEKTAPSVQLLRPEAVGRGLSPIQASKSINNVFIFCMEDH